MIYKITTFFSKEVRLKTKHAGVSSLFEEIFRFHKCESSANGLKELHHQRVY